MKGAISKDETDPSMDSNVKKPSMLEFMGLAGNFGHLNCRDPFDVKKRGSSYVTEIRAGMRVWSLYRAGWAKLHLTGFCFSHPDRHYDVSCNGIYSSSEQRHAESGHPGQA